MIKRLLIVLTIAGGVVMVPYWVGNYAFDPYLSVVGKWITGLIISVLLGAPALVVVSALVALLIRVIDYIRYGSFILLLFLGLGVHAQTRSSGFIAIPAQEYFRLKDSVNKLNRVNDSLMKGVVLYLNHWIDELRVNDSLRKELDTCNYIKLSKGQHPIAIYYDSSFFIDHDTVKLKPHPVKKKPRKHPLLIAIAGKGESRFERPYWTGEILQTPYKMRDHDFGWYWPTPIGKPEETFWHKVLSLLAQSLIIFVILMLILFFTTFKFKNDEAV